MTDRRTDSFTIALAQMDIAKGDVERNVAHMQVLAAEAAAAGAAMLLLPELWSTAYDLENAARHARTTRTLVLPALDRAAREHGLFIAGSVLLDDELGRVSNSALVTGPLGIVGEPYRKIHLFGPMAESRHLSAGDATVVCVLPWCDAGLAICYDLRFPEMFRAYTDQGVELILMPAEWPSARREHWQTLVRARAIENLCFVAACNRIGNTNDTDFGGGSMLVGPWGDVVIDAGDRAGLSVATVDMNVVRSARTAFPALADRRPECFATHHTTGARTP